MARKGSVCSPESLTRLTTSPRADVSSLSSAWLSVLTSETTSPSGAKRLTQISASLEWP